MIGAHQGDQSRTGHINQPELGIEGGGGARQYLGVGGRGEGQAAEAAGMAPLLKPWLSSVVYRRLKLQNNAENDDSNP